MQKLTNIIVLITVIALSNFCQAKEMDKNGLFNKLKKEYSKIETVHLQFSIRKNTKMLGELYAQRGGKMRLLLKNNIIISNGKTIWNISPGSSVSISDYEPSNEFALENIFFDLIKELKPTDLRSVNKSNSSEKYNLTLKPKENSNYNQKVESINIYFDTNQNIVKVSVNDLNGNSTSYYINSIVINPNIGTDKFTYKPDGNIEIIDFR